MKKFRKKDLEVADVPVSEQISMETLSCDLDRCSQIMKECFRGAHKFLCDGASLNCTRCGMVVHLTMDQRMLMTSGIQPIVEKSMLQVEAKMQDFDRYLSDEKIPMSDRYSKAWERYHAISKTFDDYVDL